ncbi:glycogen debranching N-terminal domain-containing protein [Microbacterium lushaniae]|uniref:Amylo-alpha-1,6-glucosidase n=1 Tax=Microbacterium lushaniae TaxID=2614639 RepID=A0A5J6L5S6_9MICO|nr:glycogen debranching N-terminal domain-containing protein [Microbacterium lushaniae]QEW03731.1 amylo-alpha-1,6-glucosidase [Microbacterium lushaniae]
MTRENEGLPHPLQPLLSDAVIALRAPTQVWSRAGGDSAAAIDGIYHGDVRHVRDVELSCAGSRIEWISVAPDGPARIVFNGLLRALDDATPDPKVRLTRDRRVEAGRVRETFTVRSHAPHAVSTTLTLRLVPDFALLYDVKSGAHAPRDAEIAVSGATATARAASAWFEAAAPGADVAVDGGAVVVTWAVDIPPRGEAVREWAIELRDDTLVVQAAAAPGAWARGAAVAAAGVGAAAGDVGAAGGGAGAGVGAAAAAGGPRLARWLEVALGDLDALRLALPDAPGDEFFAAGAPWFFTLFGRDSLWAARLTLPLGAGMAASTLRVLARLQGTRDDPATAQEQGKILHELRSSAIELPGEGVVLPPQYYGSVDATPLWICLLADAWRAGMPDAEVRELMPALRGALAWMREHGDSDGDGFLDYIDRMGTGLANQGWKDSGDSIQWRDGTLATGPIALCEVQGYAYEAARGGADLLAAFGDDGDDPAGLRTWAADLKARFAEAYWVQTPEGRYPAVALDRDKKPVDTLTSNIGHLLGTGILEPDEEAHLAGLLLAPTMSSGYGIRTMSTQAAGFWPLSYHGGSVWVHDTAIAIHGLLRAGLLDAAAQAVDGLLAAAEGFAYRVPELHAGDAASETPVPVPYPAACRPQAWSAAAAVTCLQVLTAVG